LAENQNTSYRTKHVDICFHFIRQHIQEGNVKVEFVRSRENDADLFTKTSMEIHSKNTGEKWSGRKQSMKGQHRTVQQ